MLTVLLVLQVIVTVSMVVVILIQRSSADGMAGLAGGGNSLMSGRASANLLTKTTSILAAIFIINSLTMATISARSSKSEKSIIDHINIEQQAPAAPLEGAPAATDKPLENAPAATDDAAKAPAKKAKKPNKPAVPIAE